MIQKSDRNRRWSAGSEGTPMPKVVHVTEGSAQNTAGVSLLDEVVRVGARPMLAAAFQAEVTA